MKTKEITLGKEIEIAKRLTKEASEVKDYKLNAKGKKMKRLAAELAAGKGYFIGTIAEANERGAEYPVISDHKKHVWGFAPAFLLNGKMDISFVCMR